MSYNYLFKKLENSHGAYIENLIFIPSEVLRTKPSEAFEDFTNNNLETICETLNWRKEKEVYKDLMQYIDEKILAQKLLKYEQTGFLAECHFPECSNFKFDENSEVPFSWSVHNGSCRIEWLYAETIGELIEKIVDKSHKIFKEQVKKEQNKNATSKG